MFLLLSAGFRVWPPMNRSTPDPTCAHASLPRAPMPSSRVAPACTPPHASPPSCSHTPRALWPYRRPCCRCPRPTATSTTRSHKPRPSHIAHASDNSVSRRSPPSSREKPFCTPPIKATVKACVEFANSVVTISSSPHPLTLQRGRIEPRSLSSSVLVVTLHHAHVAALVSLVQHRHALRHRLGILFLVLTSISSLSSRSARDVVFSFNLSDAP